MKLSYRNATQALPDLCQMVMKHGEPADSRNGATRELTMLQIELTQPWPLEITATDRKVSIAAQIAETMWVLSGRNDVEWLAHYLPQAPNFSDDGKTWRGGYGPRLRNWDAERQGYSGSVDQLQHVVDLINEDPTTRRAVMSIYDPVIDTEPGKDIPCNNWLHFLPRKGKLNLHVAIRSNDLMWGWSGINSFEWSALLVIVAGLTGLEPGSVTFSISSLHLYERHFTKANRISAARGTAPVFPNPNPMFHPKPGFTFDWLVGHWFNIEQKIRENTFSEADLADAIRNFPEPMLRSWLQVLAGWWKDQVPQALIGTSLGYALAVAPKPKRPEAQPEAQPEFIPLDAGVKEFLLEADTLHRDKDMAYGNSWYKRGEQMSIMANIARKVDRLGVDGGGDTSLDTALDLMIYLAKYKAWLSEPGAETHHGATHCDTVHYLLGLTARGGGFQSELKHTPVELEQALKQYFGGLEILVTQDKPRQDSVSRLLSIATALAYKLRESAKTGGPVQSEQAFLGNAPVTDVDQWRAENASKFFNGYADPEDS